MSIIDSYDNSEPLICPEHFNQSGYVADDCIVTFSKKVLDDVLERFECTQEAYSATANGDIPIYSLMYEGRKLLFYMSPVGAASAGCVLSEVHCLTGAKNFFVFGSCGILDAEKARDRFIIPTESYRDEGMSYHYVPAADYIRIRNSDVLKEQFQLLNLPFVTGRSWTTDALYRETVNNIAKRKAEGCISVEMESAGLQAVCDYEGYELYTFFFGSDLVDGAVWENIYLGTQMELHKQMGCFDTVLKLVSKISQCDE